MYSADKTGDKGEPWGVPLVILKMSELYSLTQSLARLPVRKERVHLHTFSGKPLIRKIWAALSGLMLSKKPEMSNKMRAPA